MALPGNTDYQSVLNNYRARLAASPTANTPGVAPTAGDVSLDRQRLAMQNRISAQEGAQNRADYYPSTAPSATEGTPPPDSRLKNFLRVMGAPLSGVAGLAEAALGKGTEKGLENVPANIKEGGTFGDIARSYNIPNWISAPLGFGLDIAFDPVNWATMGTEAFIPRVGEGLVKGGLEGAGIAAKSGALEKGVSLGRLIPGLEKAAYPSAEKAAAEEAARATAMREARVTGQLEAKAAGATSEEDLAKYIAKEEAKVPKTAIHVRAYRKVNQWASDALKEYDVKMGRDTVGDILSGETGFLIPNKTKVSALNKAMDWFSGVDKTTGKVISPARKAFSGTFIGSPRRWFEEQLTRSANRVRAADAYFKGGAKFVKEAAGEVSEAAEDLGPKITPGEIYDYADFGTNIPRSKVSLEPPTITDNMINAAHIAKDPEAAYVKEGHEIGYKLAAEQVNALSDRQEMNEILKWATITQKEIDEVGEDGLTLGQRYLNKTGKELKPGVFGGEGQAELRTRIAKKSPADRAVLASTLTSLKTDVEAADKKVGEILANNPRAAKFYEGFAKWMAGFKIAVVPYNMPGAYINNFASAMINAFGGGLNPFVSAYRNTQLKMIRFALNGRIEENLAEMLTPEWKALVNIEPELFRDIFAVDPRLILDWKSYKKEVEEAVAQAAFNSQGYGKMAKSLEEIKQEVTDTLNKSYDKVITQGVKRGSSVVEQAMQGAEPTMLSNEHMVGVAARMVKNLQREAEAGNKTSALLYKYFTWGPQMYGKMDQIPRLTNAIHLSSNGVTLAELRIMAPSFGIKAEDIIAVPGRPLYKLTPLKAMEVASRMDINYAAMPAAVKLLRMMPIIGAPFASFTYGVSQQAGRTMLFNPAAFNKVQWALREMSGSQTPLEKKALESSYYSWMNSPTMVKTPKFLENNPVYLNVAKAIDWFSLSLLQDPNRNYGDRFGGKVAKMIDQSPFFKEPIGQALNDNIIFPLLIGDTGGPPEGQFGQPLYPKSAGLGTKIGTAVAGLGESVLPLSATSLAAEIPGIENAVPNQALPYLPYRLRSMINAKLGRSSAGVPTKENPVEKAALTRFRQAGVPLYKLNITNQK